MSIISKSQIDYQKSHVDKDLKLPDHVQEVGCLYLHGYNHPLPESLVLASWLIFDHPFDSDDNNGYSFALPKGIRYRESREDFLLIYKAEQVADQALAEQAERDLTKPRLTRPSAIFKKSGI